jgi:hypothetical protein
MVYTHHNHHNHSHDTFHHIQPIIFFNHQGTRRLFLFIAELTLCKTRAIKPPVTLPWQLRTNRKTRCARQW